MLPEVAHVILIDEPLPLAQPEGSQGDLAWIVGKADASIAVDAIRLAMNAELMQMQVLPAHGDLQHIVQLGDGCVTGDEQAPPDQGSDVTQRHLELIHRDGCRCLGGAHVMWLSWQIAVRPAVCRKTVLFVV